MALSRAARLRLLDSRCFLEKRKRFGSTDAVANVLDDFHVGFQGSEAMAI